MLLSVGPSDSEEMILERYAGHLVGELAWLTRLTAWVGMGIFDGDIRPLAVDLATQTKIETCCKRNSDMPWLISEPGKDKVRWPSPYWW